jgi:lipopolysaccharide transport system ATP-binding protein
MKNEVVIRVEGLGKKYVIGHEFQRGRYVTMRDVIARTARRLGRTAMDLVRGRPIIVGDELEEVWALKDCSFEVKRGEITGVVGPNGAGKSTLLKILSRITEPTEGRVTIKGRVASLLEVGTGFHPELTGRENIFLNGTILGMTRREIRAKFDEIVDFAGIEKFLDTPVKRYSSGMYVRLAFAVAAHLESEIVVVDEVLAVGDSAFQKKCLGKMREVSQGGRTVLFVSHNVQAVQTLCTRAIFLNQGMLVSEGGTQQVLEAYLGAVTPLTSTWTRSQSRPESPVFFDRIDARLCGKQPHLQLVLEAQVVCAGKGPDFYIAVDISDSFGTTHLQALPVPEPFIKCTEGDYVLSVEIDLPPLVPGRYVAHPWIGWQNSETLDWVKDAVEIVIQESPTAGRTYSHLPEHGYIAPVSRCNVRKLGQESGEIQSSLRWPHQSTTAIG